MQTTHEHITPQEIISIMIALIFVSFFIGVLFFLPALAEYEQRTVLSWSEQPLTNQNLVIHSTFHIDTVGRRSYSWYEIDLKNANNQIILHQKLDQTRSNIGRLTTRKDYPIENVSLFIAKDKNGKIIEQKFNSAVATMENGGKVKILSGNMLPSHNIVVKKTRNIIYINTIILSIVNLYLFFSIIYLYKQSHKKSTALAVLLWIFFNFISLPIIFYAFYIL